MSDKVYSLSRAIRDVLARGTPTGLEAEYHFAEARARESSSALSMISGAHGPGACLHVPLRALVAQPYVAPGWPTAATTGGGNLVADQRTVTSDLLSWSACIQAGAIVMEGLRDNYSLSTVTRLPEPQWVSETGFILETDPSFGSVALADPKRVAGRCTISRQLLALAAPGTDRLIIDDLSRSCSSQLDHICLYGDPATFPNQPRGILHSSGVHRPTIDWNAPGFDQFVQWERLIEDEDVGLSTFAYIMSPESRRVLRSIPRWGAGAGDRSIWESITNPIASNVVNAGRFPPTGNVINDSRIFFGQWSQMVIGLWASVDVLVNPYVRLESGQVEINVSLYCNVALRRPRCFGVASEAPPPPPPVTRVVSSAASQPASEASSIELSSQPAPAASQAHESDERSAGPGAGNKRQQKGWGR